MLRIIQNSSPQRAKSYYTSASLADYYTESQELAGVWGGEGAKRLGLSGIVDKKAWNALCDNRHPATGEQLTPRRKQERRVGYDLNWHVPKSVSLLYGLTNDQRILDAFQKSVDETMQEMEAELKTRVRQGGRNEDRVTGNMIWGTFVHQTARPVDGIPDPHLHAHCFCFNVTFDEAEKRWKAAQFGDLKRDASYFEAKFHSRLTRHLSDLGLSIARKRKGWDIAGFSKATLDNFSRRTADIEKFARKHKVHDPAIRGALLGSLTRERKQKDLSMPQLREVWRSRLGGDEAEAIAKIARSIGGPAIPERPEAAREAAALATEHCLERKSVVSERELLTEAMKRSVGAASVREIEKAVRNEKLLVTERNGERLVTTHEVLDEEQRITEFARRSRGTRDTLVPGMHEFKDTQLNDGQRRAVLHVLHSTDAVTIIRGKAGVGKTRAMREAVNAIEGAGKRVLALAPSAEASRGVLREQEGFANADTVARFLVDEKLQESTRGGVLWVDEAGLLGTRSMGQLFEVARKIDARIVLAGDTRQHSPVERGAALRLLETEAGLAPAEITKIQRQKNAYRNVVEALSEGRTSDGLKQLDEMGWVREVPSDERYNMLATDYVAAVKAGKSALVISPTHREKNLVTESIREELHRKGELGHDQYAISVLENLNLTEAERRDPLNYNNDADVIVFHQNAKKIATSGAKDQGYFRKGDRITVGNAPLPLDQASRFQVFRKHTIKLGAGDRVRVSRNGKTADGAHRLDNGAIYKIQDISMDGNITLENGWKVARDFGFLDYGYATTSYSAQSKTVDHVFIAESSMSAPAASREQLYVSVSRGRSRATIYTDDKEALRESVQRYDDRLSATEVMSGRMRRHHILSEQAMEQDPVQRHEVEHAREELNYGR
ncbi:MAG: MobF family relaxase [Tepidisphaeraceae bacterium]